MCPYVFIFKDGSRKTIVTEGQRIYSIPKAFIPELRSGNPADYKVEVQEFELRQFGFGKSMREAYTECNVSDAQMLSAILDGKQ